MRSVHFVLFSALLPQQSAYTLTIPESETRQAVPSSGSSQAKSKKNAGQQQAAKKGIGSNTSEWMKGYNKGIKEALEVLRREGNLNAFAAQGQGAGGSATTDDADAVNQQPGPTEPGGDASTAPFNEVRGRSLDRDTAIVCGIFDTFFGFLAFPIILGCFPFWCGISAIGRWRVSLVTEGNATRCIYNCTQSRSLSLCVKRLHLLLLCEVVLHLHLCPIARDLLCRVFTFDRCVVLVNVRQLRNPNKARKPLRKRQKK